MQRIHQLLLLFCAVLVAALVLGACTTAPPPEPTRPVATPATLANPAADYCERRGYTYRLRTAEDGSQDGVCVLDDGSSCEGWRFYNTGNCAPADDDGAALISNPAAVYCSERGYTYEIRTNIDGSQAGVCVFDDGTECDGWTFYNGACVPRTQETLQQMTLGANPAAVYCEEVGHTFELRDEADGRQVGFCQFADGSECNAWAYYNGGCQPGAPAASAGVNPVVVPPPVGDGTTLNVAQVAGLADSATVELWMLDADGGYTLLGTVTDVTLVAGLVEALDRDLALQARTRCAPQYLLNFLTADGSATELGYGCEQTGALLLRGVQPFWQTQEVVVPDGFDRLLAIARNTLLSAQP